MDTQDYIAANRAAWNEAAAVHAQTQIETLRANFRQAGYTLLDAFDMALLSRVGLTGKDVAQVACNNGRELLSIKNLGAARCVGFDIAEEFIAQARDLNQAAGLDCEFVCTDAYHIPETYHARFDLVFISIGVLGWMPDIERFFEAVRRLLRPGGWLLVYEMHPALGMFEETEHENPSAPGSPPPLRYSYFQKNPFSDQDGLDYFGQTTYESKPMYWFQHTLGDIFSAVLQQGLEIRAFAEYDHDISNVYAFFEQYEARPPLSYSLLAQVPPQNSLVDPR